MRAAAMLAKQREDLHFVTPVASPELRPLVESQVADTGIADRFRLVDGDSIEAMSAADVVMLASGTAALESALLGKPTVAAYAIGSLSAAIARMIGLRTEYFTIPNIIAGQELIPEFIQEDMKSESLAQSVWDLLEDKDRREALGRRFATLREELALGADDCAADAVIELAE
jgi:lipid-A-disaccharide synthase